MKKLKVLIADDSVIYRSQIREALGDLSWVEVAGAASNGKIAIERLQQSQSDLLILDLEMPEMNGLQTLKKISSLGLSCKVLVFSSASKRGADSTFEALSSGASDFISKPGHEGKELFDNESIKPSLKIKSLLIPKIHALFPQYENSSEQKINKKSPIDHEQLSRDIQTIHPEAILIGSSTGGPTALESIFSQLRPPIQCPIFIVQHMPPIFTRTLAERLQKMSGIPVFEATSDMAVKNNCAYVAPGNYHMTLEGPANHVVIKLNRGPLINSVRPAVDPLFSSAAQIYKKNCLGFVLTGMGSDGKDGALSVKAQGGGIVVQDEKSCVVFGMPRAVIESGAYDLVTSLSEVTSILKMKVMAKDCDQLKKIGGV